MKKTALDVLSKIELFKTKVLLVLSVMFVDYLYLRVRVYVCMRFCRQLCANSWGVQWGEGGYFRIVRGVNESAIESLVVGVWMRVDAASRRRNAVFTVVRHRHRHRHRRAAAAAAAGGRSHVNDPPLYHAHR